MSRFLYLLLSAAVAVSASAGVNRTAIQNKTSDHKTEKTKFVKASRATGAPAPRSTGSSMAGTGKYINP